ERTLPTPCPRGPGDRLIPPPGTVSKPSLHVLASRSKRTLLPGLRRTFGYGDELLGAQQLRSTPVRNRCRRTGDAMSSCRHARYGSVGTSAIPREITWTTPRTALL